MALLDMNHSMGDVYEFKSKLGEGYEMDGHDEG